MIDVFLEDCQILCLQEETCTTSYKRRLLRDSKNKLGAQVCQQGTRNSLQAVSH